MLLVHTAIAGVDDPDVLILSRKHNKKVELEGWVGGHRGLGSYFSPSSALQAARWKRCRFNLEQEFEDEWEKYVEEYTQEMRESYRKNRKAWDTLLSWERVVLVCSGENPERAVRVVLGRILEKLGARYAGELP